MLAQVRRPYLNVDARAPAYSRAAARTLDLSAGDQGWANVKYLTNEERDQIDLQARVILSRCADRVKEMETLEKRTCSTDPTLNPMFTFCAGRAAIAASRTNPLARFLPARLLPHDASSASADFVAAHHASIAWYLQRRLADASAAQKEMQEERMKRQMHRTRTLGSGAARDALTLGLGGDAPPASETASIADDDSNESWFGGVPGSIASSLMASVRGGDTPSSAIPSAIPTDESDSDDELELSQSQILQFEAENAAILREVQDTLQSVQQAEARLLEIASLQTELVTQLTRQTEITDQLYEDAVAATGAVEKGNVQLREAKQRAKDSRLFILVFLIGASFSLLFLHYY
jgi:syntaxin 18